MPRCKREPLTHQDFKRLLDKELRSIRAMLVAKNKAYGNSALEPVRVFSKASPVEQLLVRLDDKVTRILRGRAAGEDTEQDLLGYLVILRIARRLKVERPVHRRHYRRRQPIAKGKE